jgi:anti-sigma B factor antagonist
VPPHNPPAAGPTAAACRLNGSKDEAGAPKEDVLLDGRARILNAGWTNSRSVRSRTRLGPAATPCLQRRDRSVDGPQPEMDGRKPTSADGIVLAVVGDVPDGRVLLAGELDGLTAPHLEQLLTDLLSSGHRHVSVDCSGVDFLAAAGLNVFCRATCRYQEAGGRLQLVAIPRQIRRLLAITGLDTRLNWSRGRSRGSPASLTWHRAGWPAPTASRERTISQSCWPRS